MMREGAGGAPSASSRHEPVEEEAGVSIVAIVNVEKGEKTGQSVLSPSLQWLRGALKEFKHFEYDDGKQVVQLDWFRNERDSMAGELNGSRLVQDEISGNFTGPARVGERLVASKVGRESGAGDCADARF